MTSGFRTHKELRDETGLADTSIKMYTNGYLERVRHKPYRIVKGKKNGTQAWKLENISEVKNG